MVWCLSYDMSYRLNVNNYSMTYSVIVNGDGDFSSLPPLKWIQMTLKLTSQTFSKTIK